MNGGKIVARQTLAKYQSLASLKAIFRKSGAFKGCRQAPRSGAELEERSDEASGLERGARGHKPHQFEAAGAGFPVERIIGKMSGQRPLAAVEKPDNGQASGNAIIGVCSESGGESGNQLTIISRYLGAQT
jgi:hypothetical protein